MTAPSTEPTQPTPADPAGATPPAPAPTVEPPAANPDGKPLGPGGEKALHAERDARAALEKQLRSLGLGDLIGVDVSALKTLAQALGGKPTGDTKTDLERLTTRLAEVEKTASEERMLRLRLEVATEKGLTSAQAARLSGSTKEELVADADALLSLFPTATPAGTPKPDPSQGVRSAGPPDLDALIADAESKGDTRTAIQLKVRKLTSNK